MVRPTFEVKLQNEDVAAWMVITNSFVNNRRRQSDPTPLPSPWHGVLIQLGQYQQLDDAWMSGFDQIEFRSAGQVVQSLTKDDFLDPKNPTWVNVVARPTGSSKTEPMDVTDLPKLLVTDTSYSLHRYLKPHAGGITIWTEGRYNTSVEPFVNSHGVPKTRHTFQIDTEANDDLRVEIHRGTKTDPEVLFDVDEIEVIEAASAQGGVHKNPPQR